MEWIDTHCHLDYKPLSEDINQVKKNMKSHNVFGAMSISTTIGTLDKSYDYLDENIWFSVGVHPLDAEITNLSGTENYLQNWIGKKNVVAIGEAGLDGFKGSDLQKQIPGFELQLKYAEKYNLPFVLHMRDAEEATMEILKKYNVRGIAHCYTGSLDFAKFVLDKGWMISFSGIVTFKNANHVRDVVEIVPLDRILVETDAPYLAPVPHRGESNEPAFVSHVGKYVANLKNVDVDEFANITSRNFLNLLGD